MICTFSTPISGALHGSISGLAAAGWSCVMATKINRNRARLKADKIREIKSSLTMMEGELRARRPLRLRLAAPRVISLPPARHSRHRAMAPELAN